MPDQMMQSVWKLKEKEIHDQEGLEYNWEAC